MMLQSAPDTAYLYILLSLIADVLPRIGIINVGRPYFLKLDVCSAFPRLSVILKYSPKSTVKGGDYYKWHVCHLLPLSASSSKQSYSQ